jgi:Rad3-related DNA helicase
MPDVTGAHPRHRTPSDATGTAADASAAVAAEAMSGVTVSVRQLCEFTARHGDLDRRFTPSATALEGRQGQAIVASRRGSGYDSEITLEAVHAGLRVRGRADGFDRDRGCLEEIKTIVGNPDDVPGNRRHLHWAQLQTYGAMFCRERGLPTVRLALVYLDVETQTEFEHVEEADADALQALFAQRCEAYRTWAEQEAAHRRARDLRLSMLGFPPGAFRPGQRLLAEAVWRTATRGRTLLAQAPTGIGKTVGTLYPMLRAMPAQRLDKLAYLTCKGTAQGVALEALATLRRPGAAGALRVVVMTAKTQACEHPDKACHGESCPLAQGFFDRLPAAREQAAAHGWLDAPALRSVAQQHAICPYYLGQEMTRWADVLVGDVNHWFDLQAGLGALALAQNWRLALMVDEAHNLVERARAMYSTALARSAVRAAQALAPRRMQHLFETLMMALDEAEAEGLPAEGRKADFRRRAGTVALKSVPEAVADAVKALNQRLARYFRRRPKATGPLLEFHFELMHLAALLDSFGEHALLSLERGPRQASAAAARGETAELINPINPSDPGNPIDLINPNNPPSESPSADLLTPSGLFEPEPGEDLVLAVDNVVPAPFLAPRWRLLHAAVLFSATLNPPEYARDLLGMPADTAWLDVPPAFPPEHLQVRVAHQVSTRWRDRAQALPALVQALATQYAAHPGNYLAFFSSHAYLQQAAQALAAARPDIPQWRQGRTMTPRQREAFLARFVPDGRGIGFAVLGGVFAEGVDLPGTRLVGAFVATLGLPPVSSAQTRLRDKLDIAFGPGHGYADLVPAMQKVVQAAGRVLRTPEDRGWLWLLDDRYTREEVRRLLPPWWGLARASTPSAPSTPAIPLQVRSLAPKL